MSIIKYTELCSNFRDRTQWENPFNFSITNINAQPTYITDPICFSAPVLEFIPLPKTTNINKSVTKGWNFSFGNYNSIENAYRGAFVAGCQITESITLENLLCYKTRAYIDTDTNVNITTKSSLKDGILHLPGGSVRDGLYTGWVLVNEALSESTIVSQYLGFNLCFKPKTEWKLTHTYTLRKAYNVLPRKATSLSSRLKLNSKIDNINYFIRIPSLNKYSRITGLSEDGLYVYINPFIPSLKNEPCEIIPISMDNVQPFKLITNAHKYSMDLLGISIPNIKLKNNVKVFDIKSLYITIYINNNKPSGSFASNDPNINKCSYVVELDRHRNKGDCNPAFIFCKTLAGPSVEINMSDLSEITISITDESGTILVPEVPDATSPIMPDPDKQVKLSLKLTP
uniref:Uncharacterized protein n=1 Tax=Rhinella marina erythrocytic-like virus TaxID=2859906 RepID=A0A8F6UAE2_9VIRU|nr:hypothetical protein RMELV065 [Rhinella marina erythrocytic-like virus]